MIIFAESFCGKTEAIKRLNLKGFEIDNNKIFEELEKNPLLEDTIIDELISLEKDFLLFSIYMDIPFMEKLFNKLKLLNRPLPILIGCPSSHVKIIRESIKERLKRNKKPLSTYIRCMLDLGNPFALGIHYRKFRKLKKIYPKTRAYNLDMENKYVSDVLSKECEDIISPFKDESLNPGLLKKQRLLLGKTFPHII